MTRWIAALLPLCLLMACTPQQDGAAQAADRGLVVYTSHSYEVYAPVVKEFKERTGIWVTVETGGSYELLERLGSEKDAPRCDVLFGGYAFSHEAWRDCFETYHGAGAEQLYAFSQESVSTPFSVLPIVITYNSKAVADKSVPTGWGDLLLPQWKGQIAFSDPAKSVSGYMALSTLMQSSKDPWQALDLFAANIDGNILPKSDAIVPAIVDGQFLAGITLEEVAVREVVAGAEVTLVYPEGGTSALVDATSLVKGAPHPDEARQFIDFTVSRDIQQMITTELCRRPVRSDVTLSRWLPPLEKVAVIDFDESWALRSWDDVLERWHRQTDHE